MPIPKGRERIHVSFVGHQRDRAGRIGADTAAATAQPTGGEQQTLQRQN